MKKSEITQLKKGLTKVEEWAVQRNPDIADWSKEFKNLVLETAKKGKATELPIAIKKPNVTALVKELAGEPPYKPKEESKLRQLNDSLLAGWHADNLAFVPAPPILVDFSPRSGMTFTAGDELLVNSLEMLWDFLLNNNLNPEKNSTSKTKLTKEDHRACSLILCLLVSGDMLVDSPARGLAGFLLRNLDIGPIWTMVSWHKNNEFRWPLSWVTITNLMKLLALIPRRKRSGAYFLGDKYYETKSKGDHRERKPVKTKSRKILLHEIFNRWLAWLSAMAQEKGIHLPTELTLRSAIKAGRRRAALIHSQGVVQYLSGKLNTAPQDQNSWAALHGGIREEPSIKRTKTVKQINPRRIKNVDRKETEPTSVEKDQADGVMREAISLIQGGFERKETYDAIALGLKRLAEKLPCIPAEDGEQAFQGGLRASLMYLGYCASQTNPPIETLQKEAIELQDLACSLLGRLSLASLSSDDLTSLAAEYMVSDSNSPDTLQQRRTFIKRFFRVTRAMGGKVFDSDLGMEDANWRHPEVQITWKRKARTVLTPCDLMGLIDGSDDEITRTALTYLASLGYYCTMREGEALSLTADNCRRGLDGYEMELTYSKTRSGLRALPISLMVPRQQRQVINDFLANKLGTKSDDGLLPEAERWLRILERYLAKIAGASFHDLRHSAASFLVLKLCLDHNLIDGEPISRDLEAFRDSLERIHGSEFSRKSLQELAEGLLGKEGRKSPPMFIPLISKLMGHLEPTITVQVYLHVMEVLAAYSRDLQPWPDMTQQQVVALTEVSPTTLIAKIGKRGGGKYTHHEIALFMAKRYLPADMVSGFDER